MPRATILVTTRPGGGPDVVDVLKGDPRVPRAFPTFGPHEAVVSVDAPGHADLLEVIATINATTAQIASETLLDMEVEEEAESPAPAGATGSLRALLLLMEDKSKGCHYAHTLFPHLLAVPGVVDAYPLLGRIDDAVWLECADLADLARASRAVQALEGVRETLVLIEAPR